MASECCKVDRQKSFFRRLVYPVFEDTRCVEFVFSVDLGVFYEVREEIYYGEIRV